MFVLLLLSLTGAVSYWTFGQYNGRKTRLAIQEQAMAKCFTNPPPDLLRMIAACKRVLWYKPDDPRTLAELKRLLTQVQCEEKFELARGMADEQALGELERLSPECPRVLLESAVLVAEPLVGRVLASTRAECLAAVSKENWGDALERCGVYSRYACQLGITTDAAMLGLLQAREKLTPSSAGEWNCPESPVFRGLVRNFPAPKPEQWWVDLYPPELRAGVIAFGAGDLEKAREEFSRVQTAQARSLLSDVATVEGVSSIGRSIKGDEPSDCPDFRRAMEAELRLVGGRELATPTQLRQRIVGPVVGGYYRRGQRLADSADFRGACTLWRSGLQLDRMHALLLGLATRFCSPRAAEALSRAASCDDLTVVTDFAVEGDGFREKAEKRRSLWGCGK